MQPEFVTKPAFTIVGMKWRGQPKSQEIGEHWDQFMSRSGEIQHVKNPGIFYGAMGNYDQGSNEFDYLAGREVASTEEIPAGMDTWTIPEQHYAVFATTLPTVGQTMDQIYGEWLPSSTYEPVHSPAFEQYGENFDPHKPNSEFHVYIPVREK